MKRTNARLRVSAACDGGAVDTPDGDLVVTGRLCFSSVAQLSAAMAATIRIELILCVMIGSSSNREGSGSRRPVLPSKYGPGFRLCLRDPASHQAKSLIAETPIEPNG